MGNLSFWVFFANYFSLVPLFTLFSGFPELLEGNQKIDLFNRFQLLLGDGVATFSCRKLATMKNESLPVKSRVRYALSTTFFCV